MKPNPPHEPDAPGFRWRESSRKGVLLLWEFSGEKLGKVLGRWTEETGTWESFDHEKQAWEKAKPPWKGKA